MENMEVSKNSRGVSGMTIMITGGTGFIGSHLVETLSLQNCKVIVPYIDIESKSYFKSQGLDKKVLLIKCDVRDFKTVSKIIKKNKPDYIFHLAAQAIVRQAFDNPRETFETNIMGTVNVCEAARSYGKLKGIIVTSSDKAYGKIPRARESDPLSGNHPYESSKSSADLIAQTYAKTYSMPIVVTRFGNVYGEGDLNFSRIIPGILEAIIKNKKLKIRSDGKYIRDYVYVGDIVEALIVILKNIKKIYGEAFNVSSYENLSVLEVIKKTEAVLSKKVDYKITNTAQNEIPIQSIDFKKISKKLGWKPKSKLENTLGSIEVWYRSYFSN